MDCCNGMGGPPLWRRRRRRAPDKVREWCFSKSLAGFGSKSRRTLYVGDLLCTRPVPPTLTDRRPTLDPEVFRAQAAEFDMRVQGIRRTRDAAIATFEAERSASPRQFLELVRNVLGELMLERGAVAVLDQRLVFLSLGTVDITQDAIARIDDTFGDGRSLPAQ